MRTRTGLLGIAVFLVLGLVTGCPTDAQNGTPSATTPTGLTAAQQAAVDQIVAQIEAVFQAIGGFSALADPSFNTALDGTFGECPTVSVQQMGLNTHITLDFGEGCAGSATGGLTISGRILLVLELFTSRGTVTLDNLVIDGRQVSGTASLTLSGLPLVGLNFTGTIDFATEGVGSAQGTISFTVEPGGVTTITGAMLTVGDDTTSRDITLTNVTVDPGGNGNFLPESGMVTFESDSVMVTVTFSSQTPQNGTVQVVVGDAEPVEHQIPGVGS